MKKTRDHTHYNEGTYTACIDYASGKRECSIMWHGIAGIPWASSFRNCDTAGTLQQQCLYTTNTDSNEWLRPCSKEGG